MSTLHPQAHLATGCTTSDPVFAAVEHSYRRNGSDAIAAELGELITRAAVDIDKAVHVADTESLDGRLGILLPMGSQAGEGKMLVSCF